MPTGYTAIIEDDENCTFEQYLLRCARAFGALVSLRDEPLSAPIPQEFKPSDYHIKQLAVAEARAHELDGITQKQADKLAAAEWDSREAERIKSLEREVSKSKRYKAMLEKVQAWQPPTPDHQELKDFMAQQINLCIGSGWPMLEYYQKPTPKLTGRGWLEAQRVAAAKYIAYHRKEYAQEVSCCAGRTEWVRQLMESIR